MPALNVDLDYFDHPKVKRLQGLLEHHADIYPLRIWRFAGKFHAANGRIPGSARELEMIAGWEGKPGQLVKNMLKVALLRRINGAYEIPDWHEHQGHLISYKKRAIQANKARWEKYKKNPTSNPKAVSKESPISSHQSSTVLNGTNKNHQAPDFFTKDEIKTLEAALVKAGYVKGTMGLDMRIQELWLDCQKYKPENKIGYSIKCIQTLAPAK